MADDARLDMLALLTVAGQGDDENLALLAHAISDDNAPVVLALLAKFAVSMLDCEAQEFTEKITEASVYWQTGGSEGALPSSE